MKELYQIAYISKQGFHQWANRKLLLYEEQAQLLPIIKQIREDHPKLSCRQIYVKLQPNYMGRDRFEVFCYQHGLKVEIKKNRFKTTQSDGVIRFPNLLLNKDELTGINQLWVSDITYYEIINRVYYLTFILDVYNREIVGFSASRTLRTVGTTLPALQKAIKKRKLTREPGLIFHSDGGGQYYSRLFTNLTKHYKIDNSMGKTAYENPHAERINGTIKNDYLIPYNPKSFQELESKLEKAVHLYNQERPHRSLNNLSPKAFKDHIDMGILTKTWFINKKKKVTKKEKVSIYIN